MATVACLRSAGDALTPAEQAAVRAAVVIEPTGWLSVPVTEIIDGVPFALWDDPLLTPEHAEALAAGLEVWA